MIGAIIAGGLGNQMFQYAAGRALALRHGSQLMLDLSPSRRRGDFDVLRPFELDKLAIETQPPTWLSPLSFLLARRPSPALQRLSGWRIEREPSLAYVPEFETFRDGTYLFGYWQSWRYFDSVADQLYAELQPRRAFSDRSRHLHDRMMSTPSLSLHVRRGDYLTSPRARELHGVLGLDYYTAGVRLIQRQVEGLRAFVFSDDLQWCRETFTPLGLDLEFVEANQRADSWQDLFLMAACRHSIIANSSFSWWAAWLADRRERGSDRMVVAPKHWFAGKEVPIADRYPPQWNIL